MTRCYGCPSCWYHCRKNINKLKEYIISKHNPVQVEIEETSSSYDENEEQEESEIDQGTSNEKMADVKQEEEERTPMVQLFDIV